jgi:hypothetical protein
MPTARPLIAVVGSLDEARLDYHPPVRDIATGREACAELGRALAAAGCDLLVFSSKPKYAEAHVVYGYVRATGPDAGRIVARPPRHGEITFDIPDESRTQLLVQPDTSGEWELSYYRSLLGADGILLVGGGQSTRIAGIVALTREVPLLPVAAFGGGASQVWVNLDKERNDATLEEIARMGQPWSTHSADPLVAILLAQRDRRERRHADEQHDLRRRARTRRTASALTLLALVVAWLGASFAGSTGPPSVASTLLLLTIPMVASMAGALLHNLQKDELWGWAAARGLAAGLVTVFVYIAGELVSVPDLLSRLDTQRLLFFLTPLGFTAGFTFDTVLDRVLSGQTKVPGLGTRPQPPSDHS